MIDDSKLIACNLHLPSLTILRPTILQPQLEEAIRAGDCLAMLVEHYFANKQYNEAYQYLQVLSLCMILLYYLTHTMICQFQLYFLCILLYGLF